ncbi:radical SAM/SPASM domain-containing protein [Magnetospirillum sp. SS-4]|uniref:radical SAM/SPASM domain-containing protein n=1 Tax=Magnetospirillum sp. SS-4 TaxID=2681465 RepID=UPI001381A0D5|nr:radical SAM protein [Magnetospirillum sp. SS-4]CAA7617728.1 hypothetical protein MTBSS4_20022 [Magnetospirillum sp. SS-4]
MGAILLIENQAADSPNSPAEVAALFGCDAWIVAGVQGDRFKARQAHGIECPTLGQWGDLFEFLDGVAEDWPVILRVRSPDYPLHSRLASEIAAQFPLDRFDHVLSTGEECGLSGYFLERLTPSALSRIRGQRVKVMPPGYLNLCGTPGSGRHWFSLDLRRFYYVDHFETLFDSPRNASVNMFGQCNYTCVKCPYHSSALPRKREYPGEMSLDRFAMILEKFKDFRRLRGVYPTITGEPLMHPRIVDIVRMIKDAGYACGFTTNGSLLTPEMSGRLLDAGLDGVAFSVDTLDPVKYRHLQAGGDLTEVERNILAYRDAVQNRRGSFAATINFVVGPENEGERDAYRRYWGERGFNVQFSTQYAIFDHNRPHFDQVEWGPASRMPCWSLWQGLYLTDQGRLVSCGAMAKTLGIKDSLFEMSGPDLWRCEAMRMLREQQLTGVRPGYCGEFNCWTGMINTFVADGDDIRQYSRGSTNHIHATAG